MVDSIYPLPNHELSHKRQELAPKTEEAFRAFSQQVFADGALPAKMKQIIAVAVAHVTQCPYCIRGHTKGALRAGARPEELMEAIWVAAEMRAGGAYAHSTIALATMAAAEHPHATSEHPKEHFNLVDLPRRRAVICRSDPRSLTSTAGRRKRPSRNRWSYLPKRSASSTGLGLVIT